MKAVIILDNSLPKGLLINTASILSIILGTKIENIIGPNTLDKSKILHHGVIKFPLPILETDKSELKKIYNIALQKKIFIADFTTLAQKCKTYDEYIKKISNTKNEELDFIGLALVGDKNIINKITGNLKSLK